MLSQTASSRSMESAIRVLNIESRALQRLAAEMPADFPASITLILATKGRVIVSGMGKSGHIGRKIAATLASTGTPAFFVHPSEASHGDLGMVMPDDICLMLSNSGETAELSDLIAHCARFSIPIIGISKSVESTLMKAATLHLVLPDASEACLIGMAPTTSTTLMLALGDALAVALMEARSFRPDQFRTYHPGGRLGARLATAKQLMHGRLDLPLVAGAHPITEVILTMTARGYGIAGVTDDDGRLVGVISDGDLRRRITDLFDLTASEVATHNPVTIRPDTLAAEALSTMNAHKITALFITDDEAYPLGILHIHDCLRAGVA